MHNENMTHGLFGKLDISNDTVHFNDWREVAKQAYNNSQKGYNIYRSIISFHRKNANELGLKSQADWQVYIEQHINEIAKQNYIKTENLQWACAVHEERHHPHCHIVFWDKTQQVMKKCTPSTTPNNIRIGLIKETFADRINEYFEKQTKEGNAIRKSMIKSTYAEQLSALYKEKDLLSSDIKTITNDMVAEFVHYMKTIYPGEYENLKEAFETFDESSIDADPVYNCFNPEILMLLGKQLFHLKDIMPKTGRLSYKLLPAETKKQVDKYTDMLLKNNKSLQKAVRLFVNSKLKVLQMYTSDQKTIDKAKKDYINEAKKIISNRVLSSIKNLMKNERTADFIERQDEYREYQAEQLIIGLLDLFSRLTISNGRIRDEFGGMAMSTELSKKAKKEYYLAHKDQDKSIER